MAARALHIHVMSGTGNSLRVAGWLDVLARARKLSVEWQSVGAAPTRRDEADVLAYVFPTHGFTTPWPVLRDALRLPRGRGQPVLLVATRAGTTFGGKFFPGLDGTATLLPALILACEGYRVRGLIGVDMPSNWMAVHPGFSPSAAAAIGARARPRAERFFSRFLDGHAFLANPVTLFLGLLLAPVSLGYLLVGRVLLGKLFYASDRCTGCGQCAATCPHGALIMGAGSRPYWTWRCESCMHCMAYCPERAVEISYVLLAVWLAVHRFGIGALIAALAASVVAWPAAVGRIALSFAGMGLAVVAILLLYAVAWPLMQRRLVARLVTRLTPTRWFRRYHDPAANARAALSPPGAS